jgi:ABC-type lipoprotein export system ATPase subunit
LNESPGHDALYQLSKVSLRGDNCTILDSIDLTLYSRELHLIAGPSGSGKTSLLRLLNCMSAPASGSIAFRGEDLLSYDMPHLRSRVAMISQEPIMFPGTVEHNMRIPLGYDVNRSIEVGERGVIEMLSELGLNGLALDQDAALLSGGEKQRVAIARVLMLQPEVLLADEPTSALDQLSEQRVVELFDRLKGDMTLVVVSHSTRFLEMADRIILMSGGRIVTQCDSLTPAEFAEFLGDEELNNG